MSHSRRRLLLESTMERRADASLLDVPHDVWIAVAAGLGFRDVLSCSACCQFLRKENDDNELWLHVFMGSSWPASSTLVAFAENATGCLTTIDWRDRLRARVEALPTIVVDIGRGYTKWGVVDGISGTNAVKPRLVQLSSSATSPADCDPSRQLNYIEGQLDRLLVQAASDPSDPLHHMAFSRAPHDADVLCKLRKCKLRNGFVAEDGANLGGRCAALMSPTEGSGSWKLRMLGDDGGREVIAAPSDFMLIRRANELPMLLGEPFWQTAHPGLVREDDHDVAVGASRWAMGQRDQLGRNRKGPVHVVEQARMALWAHGIDHGLVVNIGQRNTFAIPVINGRITAAMATSSDAGSVDLTQMMHRHVIIRARAEQPSAVRGDLLTWCRDMKE